jgi:hypothetical protein
VRDGVGGLVLCHLLHAGHDSRPFGDNS